MNHSFQLRCSDRSTVNPLASDTASSSTPSLVGSGTNRWNTREKTAPTPTTMRTTSWKKTGRSNVAKRGSFGVSFMKSDTHSAYLECVTVAGSNLTRAVITVNIQNYPRYKVNKNVTRDSECVSAKKGWRVNFLQWSRQSSNRGQSLTFVCSREATRTSSSRGHSPESIQCNSFTWQRSQIGN